MRAESCRTVKHETKEQLLANPSAARISRYIGRTKTQPNTGSGET